MLGHLPKSVDEGMEWRGESHRQLRNAPRINCEVIDAAAKLEFVREACKAEVPFEINASVLDARFRDAVVWRGK